MTEEPENHTIRLLQELRSEMREMRVDLTQRIDGNAVLLNMLAGLLHHQDERLTALEGHRSA